MRSVVSALGAVIVSALSIASAQTPTRDAEIELVGPGVISTPLDELNSAFSPDGRDFYYSLSADQNWGAIVVSHPSSEGWTPPVVVSFSGRYGDYDPFVTRDGRRIFFISNRPVHGTPLPSTAYNIWVSERTPTGWAAPTDLGPLINHPPIPSYYPSVAADGTLYFSTKRPDSKGHFNIYRSRLENGRYTTPENLGVTINGTYDNIDNIIAPDQSYLIFASIGRPDGLGDEDLYITFHRGGQWTKPRNLGAPVNSAALEYCPALSPDGKYLYWTSKRGWLTDLRREGSFTEAQIRDSAMGIRNGNGNIYRTLLQPLLDRLKSRP
jgi:Tol biopolymer transport system component